MSIQEVHPQPTNSNQMVATLYVHVFATHNLNDDHSVTGSDCFQSPRVLMIGSSVGVYISWILFSSFKCLQKAAPELEQCTMNWRIKKDYRSNQPDNKDLTCQVAFHSAGKKEKYSITVK